MQLPTHRIVVQAQMACIKCLFYNSIHFRIVYSCWALANITRKRHLLFSKKLIKVWFWLLFMIHTWSKVTQWSPQRQTRKDVCRENSLKKTLPLNWNKYRIRFIIKITIPYIWRFLLNIRGPFVPNNPHHTRLNDCETIMNFWGWCCGTSNFT